MNSNKNLDISSNIVEKYLFKSRNKNPKECANYIIKRNLFIMPPFKLGIDNEDKIEWHDESKNSRSLLRLLNGLSFLGDLLDAFKLTNDIKYLDKSTELILKWIDENEYEKYKDTMAYHDETTAMRLEYLLYYIIVSKDLVDSEILEKIYTTMMFTANLLASEEFHTTNTNHGMFQDLALLKYSMLVDDENAKEYEALSRRRLEEYFKFVYTNEGIHKEHSPSYHLLVTSYLKKYIDLLTEAEKDIEFDDEFEKIIENAEQYIVYITRPDGKLPNISDTELKTLKSSYSSLFKSPEYKYVLSIGKEGKAPKERDKVFKESGYAIFRDDWSKKQKMSQVIFTAAYHTAYHKHTDDLNVLFYSGEDILVEAGPHGYNYKDPFTKYAYSAYAHNTLNVLNKQLPRHDEKYEKVKLTDYYICEEYSMAEGINERFENTVHRRKVKYYNESNILEVSDDISSTDINNYVLNWHFSEKLTLVKSDGKFFIYKNNKEIGLFKISSNVEYDVRVVKGREGRSLQGWYFDKMESKLPINNIEVLFKGKNAKFTTQIIIYRENAKEYIKDIAKNERIHIQKERIKYLLKENVNSDKLCIVFSAMGSKNKFVYNYMSTLEECNVNQLFILDEFDVQGSYYLGRNRTLNVESTVVSLISKVMNELNVRFKDVILIGSSKGGYSALYYGIKYNFGHVIAGAPQSKIGNFLISEANHLELAKYISGGITEEDKKYLNNILFSTIEENSKSLCKINIHIGEGEPHYKKHVIPLVEELNLYGIKNNLDIKKYNTHAEVKIYFPTYIKSTLNKIDENIISIDKIEEERKNVPIDYTITLEKEKLSVKVNNYLYNCTYAFYVFRENECVKKQMYSRNREFTYEINDDSNYRVRIFVNVENTMRISRYTQYVKSSGACRNNKKEVRVE